MAILVSYELKIQERLQLTTAIEYLYFYIPYSIDNPLNLETILLHQDNNNLDQLIDRALENKQPILLKGNKGNAVLISEKDWNSIQETLYLNSIPGLIESIKSGGNTSLEDCVDESKIRNILNG